MEENKLNEKDIENVSGGLEENEERVWTWHRCYWPSCHIEDRVWGRIPKGTIRMCPYCRHDTFESKGIFEEA